ncbi:MAG TPA: POTRA domain-containing protein [Kofleriaceae bacterium]|nr:POTRA domain-containing protein [Kofleriaceae bacterium]
MSRPGPSARGALVAMAVMALATIAPAGCGGRAGGPPLVPLDGEGRGGAPAKVEDLRGSLVSVDVTGISKERAEDARAAVHSAVGKPFDRVQVGEDVRALFALGSVADVHADARQAQGGVALRFAVREQARIRSIDLRGSRAISPAQFEAQIPVKRGDFFDPVRLTAIRRNLLEQLRQAGFHSANVTWGSSAAKGGGLDVVFNVEEGRLVAVTKLAFQGNKAMPQKTLTGLLGESGTAVGQRYWRDALERGLARVSEQYFDMGYVNVFVGPVGEKLSQDGSQMELTIPIKEGDQYRLGELTFEGALAATKREYAAAFGLRKGAVFSRRKVSEGLDRIRALHQKKGKANVELVPQTEVDTKAKRIKVTLQVIEPGAAAPGAAPAAGPAAGAPAAGAGVPAAPASGQAAPAPAPSGPPASSGIPPARPAPSAPAGPPASSGIPPATPAPSAPAGPPPSSGIPPAKKPPAETPAAPAPAPAAPGK